jgi:heme-degrading monooxygenase HmoA
MFVALWEYEVKPGSEERFEKAYGPDGGWVRLFQSDTHYYQTRLVSDSLRPGIYLTMDFWESREAYEEFMAGRRAEYKAIDEASEALTTSERRVGWFEEVDE